MAQNASNRKRQARAYSADIMMLRMLDMILHIYQEMPTFEDISIEAYQSFTER